MNKLPNGWTMTFYENGSHGHWIVTDGYTEVHDEVAIPMFSTPGAFEQNYYERRDKMIQRACNVEQNRLLARGADTDNE